MNSTPNILVKLNQCDYFIATTGYQGLNQLEKTVTMNTPSGQIPLCPRYSGPREEEMTMEQRRIREEIVSSRPRTGLAGPFGPWLACPNICQPAQTLGQACRYGTSLSFRESELIILLTASKTNCRSEFEIHRGEALVAGLPTEVIEAIPRCCEQFGVHSVNEHVIPLLSINHRRDSQHSNQNDESTTSSTALKCNREVAMVKFCAELLATSTVSDETYHATLMAVGGQQSVLVELTSLVGYYTYVAYTLNVFGIPATSASPHL